MRSAVFMSIKEIHINRILGKIKKELLIEIKEIALYYGITSGS